jgi:hypothetical protein
MESAAARRSRPGHRRDPDRRRLDQDAADDPAEADDDRAAPGRAAGHLQRDRSRRGRDGPDRRIRKTGFPDRANDRHRLDAKIWKKRYPSLKVIAPAGAREAVEKEIAVDAVDVEFGDPGVAFVIVSGTEGGESALEVRGADGLTLVLNDIVGNIRDEHGLGGWLLRRTGFAGDEPHVPGPVKFNMVESKAALRSQLLQWADGPPSRG